MTQGMVFENQVFKLVVYQFGWCVLIALNLLTHHLTFFFHLLLRKNAIENDITKHIDSFHEMLTLDGTVIHCIFLVRESIEFSTQTLNGVDNLYGRALLCAFEGKMLTEMGQSFLTRLLMTCSCLDANTTINDLSL
jgi:hypothetical protein